jgi:rhamnosyltransferase subunit B
MARILLGWELGANRGHIERLWPMASRLVDDGHDVAIALQLLDGLGIDVDPRITIWQAPIWPRLLINMPQDSGRRCATMGDILAQLGLDRPGCLAAMVRGWEAIFAAAKPDIVVADYAPALLCAARGRIPSISVGDGFSSPPDHLETFPSLTGGPTAYDEDMLLDTVDADLVSVGRAPLAGLPALFAADVQMVGSFAELDPYRFARRGGYCAPSVKLPLPDSQGGKGHEIFVYGYNRIAAGHAIWAGLGETGRSARIHMRDASPDHLTAFRRLGFVYEPKPVPFPLIAKRSCMAVSYGGNGFTSACLIAGLPQLMIPLDLEKQLTVSGVVALGFGKAIALQSSATAFAAATSGLAADHALTERLRAAAPNFHARMQTTMTDDVIASVARLLG